MFAIQSAPFKLSVQFTKMRGNYFIYPNFQIFTVIRILLVENGGCFFFF